MSQVELAKRTGIDRADLNRLINNKRPPRAEEIRFISEVFGKTPAELIANVELPEKAARSLAAFADLEARALEGQQRAEMAEAKLSQLEATIEEERQANLTARLEADKAHRAELARVRQAHADELVRVRQVHDSQVHDLHLQIQVLQDNIENLAVSASDNEQTLRTEIRRQHGQLVQLQAALATSQRQNAALRQQIASQSGTAAATAIFGGLAGLLLGAGLASDD